MITVNQILGNINQNSNLKKKYEEMLKNNHCEKVCNNIEWNQKN